MGSPTYSAPPLNPEINSSSPFYQTLAGLVMWTRGDAPPRGIVHNGMGHACAGYNPQSDPYFGGGGMSLGSEGVIIPNSFPFNPPADGAFANDYSLAVAGTMRPRQWLYEGYMPQGGINGCTLFGIFNFQGGSYSDSGAIYPLFGISGSNYAHGGQSPSYPDCVALYTVNNAVYVACGGTFSTYNGYCWGLQFPVIPGHWYAVALARSDQVGTGINGTFSLKGFMRMYLYDLTTGTRIGPNGSGVSQTFTAGGGNTTDHISTGFNLGQYYNIAAGALTGGELTMPLTSAVIGGDGTLSATLLVKMIGIDSLPWDDSGFAYAIPGAFSGVDQFSYWINNIYEMVGSTYATGTNTGGLLTNADYDISGSQYLYNGCANASTGFAPINGAYSNTNFVFSGDAVLSDVNNSNIQITCSRPQACPTTTPSTSLTYSLYKFTECPVGFVLGVSKTNPGVVTIQPPTASSPPVFTNGQQVTLYNVGGMTQLNGNSYTVASASGVGTFQLSGTDTTGFTTYTSGGFVLLSNLGTPVATSTTGNFVYTPPDTNVYFYLITATDGTNFYFWNTVAASLNLFPDQNFFAVGNSVFGSAGRLPAFWMHLVAGLVRTRVNSLQFGIGSTGSGTAVPSFKNSLSATFGGTATNGDTVAITFVNSGLPSGTQTISISISTSETTTQMATAMAAAINANSSLVANGLGATSSGAVVNIADTSSNLTAWSVAITGSATETVIFSPIIGVPPWNLTARNWYEYYSSAVAAVVAYTGQPFTFLGQMTGNDVGLVPQSLYQSNLTAIQTALLALTTTYLGPTKGSLTYGQTINVVSDVIWLAGPWQRGGHYYTSMASFPLYTGFQQNVSNGTTIRTLGLSAYNYTTNFPDDVAAGHPSTTAARMQMMALIKDLFLTTNNNIIVGGGPINGPAIGFPPASIGF